MTMTDVDPAIQVQVDTQYLETQSAPAEGKYAFSYTITIVNLGDRTAKLETRHWIITDANGKKTEVQGVGVVGETPSIPPNSAYQYTSGTVLDTPLGFMEGRYGMAWEDGKTFFAAIPVFRLSVPGVLH